jgi:hypothetical protein
MLGRSGTGSAAMTAIPLHIQRRIEQRWASTGCVKPAKECRDESHTINGSTPAVKTKENPAEVNLSSPG